jgi:mono/diheme cytochrome c family protein
MHYPFWDMPFGYGILMAVISIVHVFISHFAIGGGFYLVITETTARDKSDSQTLGYLERLSKFFVLVTLVPGALTGVGIWFIIGLLNPAATELLIHNFVWGWAIEWTFFLVEIASAIIYYYTWKTVSARTHLLFGWIYFVAAWLSLVVINGIVAFMLTPGNWITTGNFWDGFFNPTYWSQLVFRTGICIMLAGLYAMLVASRYDPSPLKARLVRMNAIWGLIGIILMAPSFLWYRNSIPEAIRTTASEIMPTPISALGYSYIFAAIITVLLIVFGLIIPKRQHIVTAIILMAFGLLYFGSFEWFRESIRKPYVVTGYMYGNALEVRDADSYQTDGLLAHMEFQTGDAGADLFRRVCRSCHTMNGYNALKPRFDGTDVSFITAIVKGTDYMVGNMPPFLGTHEEAELIGAHIYSRIDHRHLSEIYGVEGVELGKKVYDIRCGVCHVMGGYSDKTSSLEGLNEEDYHFMLDMAGEFGEEMPDFTGDDKERNALVRYFLTLGKKQGGSDVSAGL